MQVNLEYRAVRVRMDGLGVLDSRVDPVHWAPLDLQASQVQMVREGIQGSRGSLESQGLLETEVYQVGRDRF